jgi:hypothetical protein
MELTDSATEATTAFAFVAAILAELDTRAPGFADAVFARVEADLAMHKGVAEYHEPVANGLEIIRSEFGPSPVTG